MGTIIYGGFLSLIVVFSILTILTVYDIEFVQHSAAQGSVEECEKLKVENAGSSDGIKDLSNCELIGVNLRNADLRQADLSGTDLSGADLTGADLRGANLNGAILYGADLREADLYKADLTDAILTGANLRDTIL